MKIHKMILVLIVALFVNACSTVPITGRKQLNMIPDNELMAMSFQQYDEFLKVNPLSSNEKEVFMVKDVGYRIQRSVEKYMHDHNLSYLLDNYNWEFNLVQSDQVNAWCMPGGKVVVYTGILDVAKNERGLAVVMGHEIAHAIAGHGNERMSQELIRAAGGIGLTVALNDKPQETQMIWMSVYGIGTEVGAMLPYSRLHESEADRMGLIFMSMAGFNPTEAPEFWERMSKYSKGNKPPEILSTHPSDQTRINNLNEWMPEAMSYYNKR